MNGTDSLKQELQNNIDFLLGMALQKCGNLEDAQDLTQETLLSALVWISQGKAIDSMRGWLLTVMNRKFYDNLRHKYAKPTVSISENFDIADENDLLEEIGKTDEAANIRREVAYLSGIYRHVVIGYYMEGLSVKEIAANLGISEGTVKSRLSVGREKIKKGINEMESYEKQSYKPVKLYINNSGSYGMNGEPMTLVNDNLIVQNLLWLAYEKPVTVEELSKAIGIPTAYVEPIVNSLVYNELMCKVGNRVYTDFIIYTVEDITRYIQAQKNLVAENFDLFWNRVEAGLEKIRARDYYLRGKGDQQNALELYYTFACYDYGIFANLEKIFGSNQTFKNRPNGGKWIAFGNVQLNDNEPDRYRETDAYSYAGERHAYIENYLDSKEIAMHVYDPSGFSCRLFGDRRNSVYKPAVGKCESDYLQLMYLIHAGIDPNETGFNIEILKAIPWLTECKLLRTENGKPVVNVPVLTSAEAKDHSSIFMEAMNGMTEDLMDLMREYYKDKEVKIPAHLTSVPLQKQYMLAENAILFAVVREAMKRGKLYNGDYDNGVQPPYPMVLVFD